MPVNAGPGVMAPLAEYDEPEDLNVQADLGKKIKEMGASFTREYFTGRFGLKPEEFTLEGESVEPAGANFRGPGGEKGDHGGESPGEP